MHRHGADWGWKGCAEFSLGFSVCVLPLGWAIMCAFMCTDFSLSTLSSNEMIHKPSAYLRKYFEVLAASTAHSSVNFHSIMSSKAWYLVCFLHTLWILILHFTEWEEGLFLLRFFFLELLKAYLFRLQAKRSGVCFYFQADYDYKLYNRLRCFYQMFELSAVMFLQRTCRSNHSGTE